MCICITITNRYLQTHKDKSVSLLLDLSGHQNFKNIILFFKTMITRLPEGQIRPINPNVAGQIVSTSGVPTITNFGNQFIPNVGTSRPILSTIGAPTPVISQVGGPSIIGGGLVQSTVVPVGVSS